jgi:hypothetical protein
MKELFRRVRLITPILLNFPIDKDQFVQRLQPHVAPAHLNPFGRLGTVFSLTAAPYTGVVTADSVRIKPRVSGNQAFLPIIQADLLPEQSGTRLEGELNGVSFFVIAPTLFYSAFLLFSLAVLVSKAGQMSFFAVVMLLFVLVFTGAFLIGLPYFMARRRMQQAAYELERDLFYFVERPPQAVQPTSSASG